MRKALAIIALSLAASGAFAEGYRDILSFQVDGLFKGDVDLRVENASIFDLAPGFAAELHIWYEDLGDMRRTVIQPGLVIGLGEGSWTELLYGMGFSTDGAISHEAYAGIDYESDALELSAACKFTYFAADSYWYAVPNAGFGVALAPGNMLRAKVYASLNSYMQTGFSLFVSDTVALGDFWSIWLGATAGLDFKAAAIEVPNAFSLGFKYKIDPKSAMRIGLEYRGTSLTPDLIRFFASLDAKF